MTPKEKAKELVDRYASLSDSKLKKFMESGHIINDSGYGTYISLDEVTWYKKIRDNRYRVFNVDELPEHLQEFIKTSGYVYKAKQYAEYLVKEVGKLTAFFVVEELETFYSSQFVLEGSDTERYLNMVKDEVEKLTKQD